MSRLKNKDEHSFGEKAAAVLTTGMVGAAAFYKLGGNRLLSEGLPKANKFISEVSKDFYNKRLKDFTYENIEQLTKKHLTDPSSTLKTILSEDTEKIKLKLDGDSLQAAVVKIEEIKRNPDVFLKKLFKTEYKDEIFENVKDTYENSDENNFQIKGLIDEIIEKRNLISYVDKADNVRINEDVIESYINPNMIKDKETFFNELMISVEDIDNKYKEYKDKHYNEESKSYDIIDNILDKITREDIVDKFGEDESNFKTLMGEKALTLRDYIDNTDKFDDQIVNINGEELSIKELLKEFSDKYSNIDNVLLDSKNLRKDSSGNIINLNQLNAYKENILTGLAGTIPGKLLKITDRMNKENISDINLLRKGTAAFGLSSLDGEGGVLNNSYMKVFNKIYKLDEDNSLNYIKKIDDEYSRNTAHGSTSRVYSKMMGTNAERKTNSSIRDFLDIGTTLEKNSLESLYDDNTILGGIARKINGVTTYNIIDKILDSDFASSDPIGYRKNLKSLNSIFSNITETPSKNQLRRVMGSVNNNTAREILDVIQNDDIDTVLNGLAGIKTLNNNDLNSLIKTTMKDRNKAGNIISIKSDKINGSKKILSRLDIIKKEAFKEAMLKESAVDGRGNKSNFNNIINALSRSGLSKKDYKNLETLSHWAVIQNEGKMFNSNSDVLLEEINKSNLKVLDLLTSKRNNGDITKDVSFIASMADNIRNIKHDYKELTTRSSYERKGTYKHAIPLEETMIMRRGYTHKKLALDLLNNMNDFTKQKADLKKFGMQFIAGRNSSQYITDYTMMPYFLTDRLIQPLNKLGLGFSNKNTSSVLDQWKNIILKRVMPIAGGITALSYLNYEAKNITGTSVTGALVQGAANVDLGLRRIGDTVGIGHILQKERELNPISQYWLGKDYQDYSERKDYYENGYDEVRKGRWWAFGSASEFRGTKTLYFQPNYVKRINSDWKDIGLYGSSKEKWKHSWIPTPTHPLSTVRRLLDPYWLERKHYNDRPYMKTAPLFSEGTPWGAVLNPTIGEMIKPIKRMHKNETRRGLTDPRTLIRERNEDIKNKAINKNKENLFKLSRNGISNISYTPTALADSSKMVINLKVGNGEIQGINYNGIGYSEGVNEISEYNGEEKTYVNNNKKQSSFLTSLESSKIGTVISNSFRKSFTYSTQIISQNNEQIKAIAASGSKIEKVNLADIPARMAAEKMTTKQNEADLRLISSKQDFISDTLFSAKQLSGIWGFISGQLFKSDERRVKIETADNMVSFKRSFWDSNIGGLGGGVMEIARRFFPHNDHSIIQINPIRNTMPSWMPSRFTIGDPYTKVQKGEMRLPGKGYEAIHKLRPDEYGRYGSLDRMRILADIAPWSDEYKVWRDIASKSIKDGKGKKEIEEIKKRVEQQSKNHEFYNYKYLNTPTKLKDIIIKSVSGNKITSTENKVYSLAGVKLLDKNALYNHLQEGSKVKVEYLKSDKDKNGEIKSALYINGENLNQLLVNSKQATKDNDDESPIAAKALTGHMAQLYGATMEAIAHAPIPFIHNKLMKIDTPIDSYLNDRVYGTNYSTWDHPIKGFIIPGFQKAWGRNFTGQGIALGAWYLAEKMWSNEEKVQEIASSVGMKISKTGVDKLASVIMNVANPGAFAGAMMGTVPTGLMGNEGIKGLLSADVFGAGVKSDIGRNAARYGATAMIAGYGLTRADNPIKAAAIFSLAGMSLSNQLKHPEFTGGKGAIAGAMFGIGLSAIKNPNFNKEKMFGEYIPKSTVKRRDIDEYYDRLEYVKFKGLYEKSARKALIFEKTNIKNILETHERKVKENDKKAKNIQKKIDKISNSYLEENRKSELINSLLQEKKELVNSEETLKGGKYTKAAIAYKQAYESTIYGLNKNSTFSQIMRAIPKGEKDYFVEFMEETDKKKRKKILKYISPYQRKAMQIMWGEEDIDKVKDNKSYFKNHFLPGVFWAGWKPQVDLDDVKIKTIENEGMLLSDFGFYDSQKDEPATMYAPSIGQYDRTNDSVVSLKAKLEGSLNGLGLIGVKVSVTPSNSNGIEIISNITNSAKITEYKIRNGINKVFGTRMFY